MKKTYWICHKSVEFTLIHLYPNWDMLGGDAILCSIVLIDIFWTHYNRRKSILNADRRCTVSIDCGTIPKHNLIYTFYCSLTRLKKIISNHVSQARLNWHFYSTSNYTRTIMAWATTSWLPSSSLTCNPLTHFNYQTNGGNHHNWWPIPFIE